MPVKNTSKRGKKRVKTRRVVAGAPKKPNNNKILSRLVDTALRARKIHFILDPYIMFPVEELSPYAMYNGRYLLDVMIRYLIFKNTKIELLLDVIHRTISIKDHKLINENKISDWTRKLLLFDDYYNDAIKLLLHSIPPIKNKSLLTSMYMGIIFHANEDVLMEMLAAGHVPLTRAHVDEIKNKYNDEFDIDVDNEGPKYDNDRRFFDILYNNIKPVTETTSLLNSLNKYKELDLRRADINIDPDNVEDLHSHLRAIAEDEYINQPNNVALAAEENADY